MCGNRIRHPHRSAGADHHLRPATPLDHSRHSPYYHRRRHAGLFVILYRPAVRRLQHWYPDHHPGRLPAPRYLYLHGDRCQRLHGNVCPRHRGTLQLHHRCGRNRAKYFLQRRCRRKHQSASDRRCGQCDLQLERPYLGRQSQPHRPRPWLLFRHRDRWSAVLGYGIHYPYRTGCAHARLHTTKPGEPAGRLRRQRAHYL